MLLATSVLMSSLLLGVVSIVATSHHAISHKVSAGVANLAIGGSDVFTDGVATIKTSNDNDVRITSTGNGLTLAAGEALYNSDMIQGLTSMTVVLTSGTAKVYGDYESGLPRNRLVGSVTTSDSGITFSQGMRYFKIVADEGAAIGSIAITYDCPADIPFEMVDGILLDGIADDPIYTAAVKTNTVVVQNGQYKAEFTATKTATGVIAHVDYYVPATKTHATNWWENDNFELRYIADTDGKYQLWASSLNGGAHNFTKGYESALVLEEGLYHMTYEEFESYDALSSSFGRTINASSPINFMAGLAWNAGWTTSNYWYARANQGNSQFGVGYFVTEQGIVNANIEAKIEEKTAQSTGSAMLSSPFSVTATGWNLASKNIAVDGSADFSVVVDLDSVGSRTYPHSWVADISSCNINEGNVVDRWVGGKGWSMRSDWWGWGSWNNGSGENPAGWHDESHVGSQGYAVFKEDMHIRLCIEKVNDLLYVYGKYIDNDDSNLYNYIYYVSSPLNYSGPITLNFGATGGAEDAVTVTYNSFTLISGTALATA